MITTNAERNGRGWPTLLASPLYLVVAGARNHLQANRSLGFCFEIPV
jgi:hypothetical protein